MIRAAGVLLLDNEGCALFLQRSAAGDHAGEWNFPGGKIEDGETAEEAAIRECREETGTVPGGEIALLTRQIAAHAYSAVVNKPAPSIVPSNVDEEEVDFTTFMMKVDRFEPKLNEEHTGFCWAPLSQPPQPLHPGCNIALRRMDMNELDIARAIASGELASPHFFHNVWLFALRITGTGVAFRPKRNEFAIRDPSIYLTPDFLARCNGLPVVFIHSEGTVMTSEEYRETSIGSVFLPYIKGDEVWGVCRIYDEHYARLMQEKQLSTSPGVVLRGGSANTKLTLEDGSTLLVEGEPALLDNLAICGYGVWDKGEGPSGVDAGIIGEDIMVDVARKDEEKPVSLTALSEMIANAVKPFADGVTALKDSVTGVVERLGTLEEKVVARKDAADADDKDRKDNKDCAPGDRKDEEEDDDKSKKDAADEDKERKDSLAAMDKHIDGRLEEFKKLIPKGLSDEDHGKLSAIQARADAVFNEHGERASRPLDGESPLQYERRLVSQLQKHSPTWKDIDLTGIKDEAAFNNIALAVYKDASTAARSPTGIPGGKLRAVKKTNQFGHQVTEYHGSPASWMTGLGLTPSFVLGFPAARRSRDEGRR